MQLVITSATPLCHLTEGQRQQLLELLSGQATYRLPIIAPEKKGTTLEVKLPEDARQEAARLMEGLLKNGVRYAVTREW